MKGSQTMLKPAVICTGVHKACKSELPYIPQTLVPWMFYEVEGKIAGDTDKPINRIVDYFPLIRQINHLEVFKVQK
jgi:hypothetical protein